jgi:ribonuclease-3
MPGRGGSGGKGSTGASGGAALRALERRLGHRFADIGLLERALTHKSRSHEEPDAGGDNEALEFLGDAVVGFVVTDLIHRRDPQGPEGEKSRLRAELVSMPSLARRASELGLPDLLRLGRGEEKTGGRKKPSLWADAYEALVAALYLDAGLAEAHRFVREEFERDLSERAAAADPKSRLQELLQGSGRARPEYRVVMEAGPSHSRRFRVECRLDDGTTTAGEGSSKKAAEQEAARRALERLQAG